MSEKKKIDVAEILKDLEKSVEEIFSSEYYLETFLKTYSKFHNYSLNNILWILQQRPEATYIASFIDWDRKFNRKVKKGAHGIKVLVPIPKKNKVENERFDEEGNIVLEEQEMKRMFFKVGHVFDVADTVGEELPTLTHQLTFESDFVTALVNLIANKSETPIIIDDDINRFGGANGFYSLANNDIHVRSDLSGLHQLKTILHELSHALQETKYAEVETFDRKKKEVVAEATAYATMRMLQEQFQMQELDSSEYSFGYICGWSSGKELSELKETLKLITDISNELFDWIMDLDIQSNLPALSAGAS